MTEIENLYAVNGGRFISPESEIRRRLEGIKAFVFDWDGVFNNGFKTISSGSGFSEIDSMGINLLRYSWYLRHGALPSTAIISGEKNDTAFYFCEREGFTFSFHKFPHKIEALNKFCEAEGLKPEAVAYFFDDVLDIPIAEKCGLRILVNQQSNPQLVSYCLKHRLVDYLTAARGGEFAVREGTELLVGLHGNFDQVIEGRIRNTESYKEYINRRRAVKTSFFTVSPGGISTCDPLRDK